MITDGFVSSFSSLSPVSISAMMSRRSCLTSAGSVAPVRFTAWRSLSHICMEVSAPISERISVSSSSSKKSSSIFVKLFISSSSLLMKPSFVFFRPFFSFSKNPCFFGASSDSSVKSGSGTSSCGTSSGSVSSSGAGASIACGIFSGSSASSGSGIFSG